MSKSNKTSKREQNVAKFVINVMTRGTLNREAQLRVLARVQHTLTDLDEEYAEAYAVGYGDAVVIEGQAGA